jgi:hypothetical protein
VTRRQAKTGRPAGDVAALVAFGAAVQRARADGVGPLPAARELLPQTSQAPFSVQSGREDKTEPETEPA